jgi:pseudaminic acid synthase
MSFKKPFLIAEISANHCGNFKLAKKLIKCAKINGADAVKLQTYTPETMTINSNKRYFKITRGLWKGYNLWNLYEKAQTPLEWHERLFSYARKIGIKIFSTPFDETAVDFLEKLHCPFYKVSSFEMTDISLIKKIARTKKPMIISTGMATIKEIELTYETAKKYGCKDITLLYCVSNYPSKISDFNLNNIKLLKKKFKCKVGLSDHSQNNKIAMTAVACGAEVIEKHIALDGQNKGLDIKFSLKGKEIKKFREDIDAIYKILGKDFFFRSSTENKSKKFRRSIFAIKNIKKGEKFSVVNIKKIRPGDGLSPIYFERILSKKSKRKINIGEPLNYADLDLLKDKK